MRLPDGTILMHDHAPYDPVKAHEYYIRTRQLKGRKKGQAIPPPKAKGNKPTTPTGHTFSIKLPGGKTLRISQQELAQQRTHVAQRVNDLKKSISEATAKLNKLKAKATKSKADANKPPTAAEKAKAAKESKQYRSKHKQEISNKTKEAASKDSSSSSTSKSTTKTKSDPVAELDKKISQLKGSLAVAETIQKSLSAATKNG